MIKEKHKYSIHYEILFTILAVIAVTIAILDITGKVELSNNKILYIADNAILFIFIVDYFARLIWIQTLVYLILYPFVCKNLSPLFI